MSTQTAATAPADPIVPVGAWPSIELEHDNLFGTRIRMMPATGRLINLAANARWRQANHRVRAVVAGVRLANPTADKSTLHRHAAATAQRIIVEARKARAAIDREIADVLAPLIDAALQADADRLAAEALARDPAFFVD